MSHDTAALQKALLIESQKFQECYLWLLKAMPENFFGEISEETLLLITHALVGFELQDFFCTLNLKKEAVVLTLDAAAADLHILESFSEETIKGYLSFVSKETLPFRKLKEMPLLRIGVVRFSEELQKAESNKTRSLVDEVAPFLEKRCPHISKEEIIALLEAIDGRFLQALSLDKIAIALELFQKAKQEDLCQLETIYQEDFKEKGGSSLQIILAWKNTPKYHFLWRIAYTVFRHHLVMKRVNATYVDPYGQESILLMALDIHGAGQQAAWEEANLPEFLRELCLVKYFATLDLYDEVFVRPQKMAGFMANFLRALEVFVHQACVLIDPNIYTLAHVREALVRHPAMTERLCRAASLKFDPIRPDLAKFEKEKDLFLSEVSLLDTGNEEVDLRRKTILKQAMHFIHYTIKTNLFMENYSALAFRLDPRYLEEIPLEPDRKLPTIPYAIFFIKGMHFFGFHIRFQDLARGGVRTVFPESEEHVQGAENQIFSECYNLALTQQKKNKDIPEGGAKGIIFLKPYARLTSEVEIYKKELKREGLTSDEIENKIIHFRREQRTTYLYEAQRAFIENLLLLVNADTDGVLKEKKIIDYWKKPEYLYLGPDENMHNPMIEWIAATSKRLGYTPGTSFMSGKPRNGINHKEYGVTSLGLNVYVEELLKYAGIDPKKDSFTVKMAGGPDGDVAGNELLQLYKNWPDNARVVALRDISGTIYDPYGLDLSKLRKLFLEKKAICHYPPELLHDGGFLLDRETIQTKSALHLQTLLWKKEAGKLLQEWLSGSDMNALFRTHIHKVKADIFIPAGGRPRTLHENNIADFLDAEAMPSSRLIVEGANLYITPKARRILSEMGVLIIKDSSANKTGVICSSFEVPSNLTLGDELFIKHKEMLVKQIMLRLRTCADKEAKLILETHKKKALFLPEISDKISEQINFFSGQLRDHLEKIPLSKDRMDPLIRAYFDYALPLLRDSYPKELMDNVPDMHKKAVIACHVASELVYRKGIDWFPSIPEILPQLLKEIQES